MNPFHLLWIIPLSAAVGAFMMGIVAGGSREEDWQNPSEVSET